MIKDVKSVIQAVLIAVSVLEHQAVVIILVMKDVLVINLRTATLVSPHITDTAVETATSVIMLYQVKYVLRTI